MLLRKMLRDLWGNRIQFISIFLMIFMGIFIFTGLNAIGQGMDQCSKNFYKETNLAGAFLHGENFTKEEVTKLSAGKNITNVERRLQINASIEGDDKTVIQLNVVEQNNISANHVVDGEKFTSNTNGIWLDSAYADTNKIKVGDKFSFVVQGVVRKETVKGLIMNPEYVYALKDENEVMPDHKYYGYGFLSADEFGQGKKVPFNQLLIETTGNKSELEDIITNIFGDRQSVLVMQKDLASVKMFENEVSQMKAVQEIFPALFLVIAILTTLTTMTRITVNQRTQIGVLKALGFSNTKILCHYMSYGVFVGLSGGVLGLILGPILLPNVTFSFQKGFYTMPVWKGTIEYSVFVIALVCILCCGLSGYFACRKELGGVAAQILRPKAPKSMKHRKWETSRWWSRMKFDAQWNIRDLFRNKVRTLITVIGIVGCMMLIVCAFGMKDTIQEITTASYTELNTYATKVNLSKTISADRIVELRKKKELQFMQETAIELVKNKEKTTTMLTVVGSGDFIKQKDKKNHFVQLATTGIVITNKFAEVYSLKIGEKLTWRVYGTKSWSSSIITQIVKNPISQGAYMSETAYQGAGFSMIPTAFVSGDSASQFEGKDFTSVQSQKDLLNAMNTLMESMNVMIAIFIIGAAVLGIVVLYNLGVLSFHEKIRELATLKVLGFQYGKLRKILQMQNIWITVFGIVLGVPAGYGLLAYMLKYMGDAFDMEPIIYMPSYIFSIFGTLALSIVVNVFLSRKLKTVDMVSALKSIE